MVLMRVEGLPPAPLDAAARFYAEVAPQVAQTDAPVVTLVFAPADHAHRGWREEAVASLARTMAPRRINAVVGDEGGAIAAAQAFLEGCAAMTGQLLPLANSTASDGHGAGLVLG